MDDSGYIRVFLDTEFSDFVDMHLLSLGLVTAEGDELYVEVRNSPIDDCSLFVQREVLPQLGHMPNALVDKDAMKPILLEWFERVRGNSKSVVISYVFFGDYALLLEAFQEAPVWLRGDNVHGKIDEAARVAFWRNSRRRRHNALNDAQALRYAYHERRK